MNLDGLEEVMEQLNEFVPQTYGEAIQLYPWIDCKPHEWDNRTTLENTLYLFKRAKEKGIKYFTATPMQKEFPESF